MAYAESERSEEDVRKGHAVYTPLMLSIYDAWVLGISHPLIWRCPTRHLLAHYEEHVSARHLEAGVGTAYLPDHARFPSSSPRITLLDLNPNTLTFGSRRLRRYRPRTRIANLLEPLTLDERYRSVALNHVLHCLPGTLATKSVVFKHVKAGVDPGGVVFGATVLAQGVEVSRPARRLMRVYNQKGIFSNEQDSLDGLASAMQKHFERYTIRVVGCVALFAGHC